MNADSFNGGTQSAPVPFSGTGGDRIRKKSEWEELEALTKDELIIELVKERTARRLINRSLRWMIDLDHPIDGEPSFEGPIGAKPPREWVLKIIGHAGPDVDAADMENLYGVDCEYAESLLKGD